MPVLPNSGGGLGEALLGGVQGFVQGRQRKRQDDLFEQQIADANYARMKGRAQDEAGGLHVLAPGELLPSDVTQNITDYAGRAGNAATPNNAVNSTLDFTGFVDPQPRPNIPANATPPIVPLSRAGAGAKNLPGAPQTFLDRVAGNMSPDRGPQYQTGKGYYIDRAPQWQQQDAARAGLQGEKLFEAQIASLLADQGVNRDVRKESLLAPIHTQQAVNTESALAPIRTGQAVATEGALAPIRSRQAIATAAGTAPIDVNKAVQIEAGTAPYKMAIAAAGAANAGNKPTEFSAKAALVYPRALQSAQILSEYFDRGAPGSSVAGRVPLVGNALMSTDAQRMNQAAETVSSAILRLESGAAISSDEIKRYAQQFLPQVGDSPEVRQQKKATLATQLERLRAASAPSMGGAAGTPPPNYTGAPPATGPVGDFNLGGDTAGKTITVNGKTFKVPN